MLQIKLFGLGGQGVVTAAKVLALAAGIYEGRYAQAIPAYGHERRGAPVFADLFVGTDPILVKSFVWQPDYVGIFDLSVRDKGVDWTVGTTGQTMYVLNSAGLPDPPPAGAVCYLDATTIALETMGLDIPNGAMLGAMAAAGLVSLDAVEAALKETFAGKAGELNARAARRACDATRKNDPTALVGAGGLRI